MKAQRIYDITMSLMDERRDDGQVDVSSTKDYLARAPGILTVLQNEISMRIGTEVLDEVTNMNADIDLEDIICLAILPYGLAARLLMQEDTELSSYFSSLYNNYSNQFLSKYIKKSKQVTRTDVYNINERAGE